MATSSFGRGQLDQGAWTLHVQADLCHRGRLSQIRLGDKLRRCVVAIA
jgi:hypothetical protein